MGRPAKSVTLTDFQTAKGPAEVTASPSHGPNNPDEENAMDEEKRTSRRPRNATAKRKKAIDALSFVAMRDGIALPLPKGREFPRCFWNVRPTGDYGQDCETGATLAVEYVRYEADRNDGAPILGFIIGDMPRPLTGLEIGFLSIVGWAVAPGAERAAFVEEHQRIGMARLRAEEPA